MSGSGCKLILATVLPLPIRKYGLLLGEGGASFTHLDMLVSQECAFIEDLGLILVGYCY